jgi:hypothetical protein
VGEGDAHSAEARHGLNYAWIVAGPLLALAWLLVTL